MVDGDSIKSRRRNYEYMFEKLVNYDKCKTQTEEICLEDVFENIVKY